MDISLHECIYIFKVTKNDTWPSPHLCPCPAAGAPPSFSWSNIRSKKKIIIGHTWGLNLHSGPEEPNNKKHGDKHKKAICKCLKGKWKKRNKHKCLGTEKKNNWGGTQETQEGYGGGLRRWEISEESTRGEEGRRAERETIMEGWWLGP